MTAVLLILPRPFEGYGRPAGGRRLVAPELRIDGMECYVVPPSAAPGVASFGGS
jgi:hypothetical protein